jgi:hypothetical protein
VNKHEGELRHLRTIERAVEARIEQLVEADIHNPPEYLRDLGRIPDDPGGSARWRAAAHYVERHRVERHVTDRQRPFGRRPEGDRAMVWHAETRRLKDLIANVDPPTPHLERGIELA